MQKTVFVSENADDFVRIAIEAQQILGGELGECAHGLDQSYWDLAVDGAVVTIHREHYTGVSVFCEELPQSMALLARYAAAKQLAIAE